MSIAESEENQLAEEEEEEPEESLAVAGRSQRGLPRRAARRARGRRGGAAARARVVSTRIHGARRNAAVPSSIDNDVNNATLEETVNTETEDSPKKVAKTPDVEQKPTEETSAGEPAASSQTDAGSNVRASGTTRLYFSE